MSTFKKKLYINRGCCLLGNYRVETSGTEKKTINSCKVLCSCGLTNTAKVYIFFEIFPKYVGTVGYTRQLYVPQYFVVIP